jgi:hypothetical protein
MNIQQIGRNKFAKGRKNLGKKIGSTFLMLGVKNAGNVSQSKSRQIVQTQVPPLTDKIYNCM